MKKIVALVLSLVMVLGLATTAFAADTTYSGLYVKGTYQGAEAREATLTYTAAKDNQLTKTGDWKADGWVAYYEITDVAGKYYVEVATVGEANVIVATDEACKNVFKYLKEADPFYRADAAVVTSFGEACGQYDENDVNYDDEKTYYTALKGELYVAVEGAAEQLMVGGKLVAVETATIAKVDHKAVITTDKKGDVVSIKCSACNAVAVKAGTYAAVPAASLADVVYTDGTAYWYWAGVSADAGDKVESAETFDAGIAMYVGMSVMAAAGSAVVLKKKD